MMEGKIPKESMRRVRAQYLQGADANPSPGAMSGINHPGMNDVMFGRGGDTNYHIGNNSFRHLVETYRERYWAATNRKEKSQIIAAIIKGWRTQDPPGRFLTKTDPSKGDESLWHDVGDQVAGRKASKILSEMRIGKKKAAAKRKAAEEASEQKQKSPKREETASPEEYLESAMTSRLMEMPAMPQQLAAPLPAMSARLRHSPTAQMLEQPSAQYGEIAAPPLLRQDTMAVWSNSFLPRQHAYPQEPPQQQQQQQQQQEQQQQQQQPVLPYAALSDVAAQQQIGDSIPVAAALTDVFQDQFIASDVATNTPPVAAPYFEEEDEESDCRTS